MWEQIDGDVRVTLFKDLGADDQIRYIDSILAMIFDGSERLHEFLKRTADVRSRKHWDDLKDVRALYPKEPDAQPLHADAGR